ncbi:MAG TPA: peptide chain release factor 1, partial [Candidatus Latescibacteria bacterium]|nr:peptide chain release factor 1 [Candidatus Latescibacterota bacterium]
ADLERAVRLIGKYRSILRDIAEAEEILREGGDGDLETLAREELKELRERREHLERDLKLLLLPKDPDDAKDIILEVRAGTGGEEAALFAADLARMYTRYAERKGWKVEPMNSNPTELGGFKEVVFAISGDEVYRHLKYESGVHRVQRVPVTESGGRIHTSAASVVVLPQAEEVEVEIDPEDLRIDVFRSSGPGGQSVNTADSAVRIVHIPTGIVVQCQDERSQLQNKRKALQILRARLLDMKRQERERELAERRRSSVRTGDRSVKIRTYNFPQNRVTDHRINFTLYRLEDVLDGDLDELIEALWRADEERLAEMA